MEKSHTTCYHCGEDITNEDILLEEKHFCCNGCKTVYEILHQNNLCGYYQLENTPGITPPKNFNKKFEYLANEQITDKLLDFKDETTSIVTLYLPQIHCSSCIWLLENLYKLNVAVKSSRVDFLKKEIKISFFNKQLQLREVVEILTSLGYEPQITLNNLSRNKKQQISRDLILKIGVAGFCFGNIMLLSLPEYFGLSSITESNFSAFFAYLNLILSVPVLLYSAKDYFSAALIGLQQKTITVDLPISLGIVTLFTRSSYEIISNTGAGYFDSLTGLVFFLLLGRIFQQRTYNTLSFERDYKSYFPLSARKIEQNKSEKNIPISDLKINDTILIRNNELIPVDSILISKTALIDNSFVTGEANPTRKNTGDKIYAGGKQIGQAIQLKVIKKLSYSYLTQLWNDATFSKNNENNFTNITDNISQYFTIIILFIALGSGLYWYQTSIKIAINVFTSVLIVACPCALALSAPFTFGNILRVLGRNKFYLKNASVIENISKINTIVFDKTGTITQASANNINYYGTAISFQEKDILFSIFRQSTHPLSKMIFSTFSSNNLVKIDAYQEIIGKGITAKIKGIVYKIGSKQFVKENNSISSKKTRVYIKINDKIIGYYQLENKYRKKLKKMITQLAKNFNLNLISGDNDSEKDNLRNYFNEKSNFLFNQSPQDKLKYIESLQHTGKNVLMIGDGLNDAGALKQSNVGISISEDITTFSPACDAILDASVFDKLPTFISYCKGGIVIIIISFIISFLYNFIGLAFAIRGLISPIFAAILMPLSSITVVLFVTIASSIMAKQKKL